MTRGRSVLRARNGMTVIELGIVLAIVGTLLALLLPAIQSSRERARCQQCINNLQQIGVAMAMYAQTHRGLPPGVVDERGPVKNLPEGYGVSWTIQILPYTERAAWYNAFDFKAGAYGKSNWWLWHPERMPSYLRCPSSPHSNIFAHFAGCYDDRETPIDADNHGVLFLNSHIAWDDLPDGRAHTLLVGEKLPHEAGDLGWPSGTRATLRNTGSPLQHSVELPYSTRGVFVDREITGDGPVEYTLPVGGFGSYHVAGVNHLFCDGRVRSINREIDQDVYRAIGHRNDGEPAMGLGD